jgi:hypothetical protein
MTPRPPTVPDDSRDTAHYLLVPDRQFSRPYLAIPGDAVFTWPMAVEGFEIADEAELGVHKYISSGANLTVDVVHKGETRITLTGTFPGWTSSENMQALRDVFYKDTPSQGKLLYLPGILAKSQFVVCESLTSAHADDERTMDIAYTAVFVCVNPGVKIKGSYEPIGATKSTKVGTRKFKTTSKINTLRKIAKKVYKNSGKWTVLYSISKNLKYFKNVPTHKVPDHKIPAGKTVYY